MKIQKITLLALAAGTLLAASPVGRAAETNAAPAAPATPAQPREGRQGGRSVEQQLARLSEQLSLTDEQKPKVKALLEDQAKKRAEYRELSQEERGAKMRTLRQEMISKMKEILTEEQFKKYEAMPGGGRGNRGQRGEGQNQGGGQQ